MRAIALISGLVLISCTNSGPDRSVRLKNPADIARKDVVSVNITDMGLEDTYGLVLEDDDSPVAFEKVDSDLDGTADQVRFVVDLEPMETRSINFRTDNEVQGKDPRKMTQAEISVKTGGEWQERKYVGGQFKNVQALRVPDEHTDHSNYIRYEGPGWESNLVGYRFYLDWRNGIDIFGKKTNGLVLQEVGQDNFDSYHEESDWGMDILKVGNSLGLGSIGRHQDDSLYRFQEVDSVYCEISENGLLRSELTTKWYDWKTEEDVTDITSVISIEAESRASKHEVSLSDPITGFCTGLAINEDEEFIDISEGDYRLLATYGRFSLNNDLMGMAVIVRNDEVADVFDDEYSHVVTFKPLDNITYYFLATWEKEPEGIKSFEEFQEYVKNELKRMSNPLEVEVRI